MELLSSEQLVLLREALLSQRADELIKWFCRFSMYGETDGNTELLNLTEKLGLLADDRKRLNSIGYLVSDVLREYLFWLERDGHLHLEDEGRSFSADFLAGRSVLEIGSGYGCNLFSLSRQGISGRFVGLEPVATYLQLTPIIAEREKLPIPEIVQGSAEDMPFGDDEFDVVLCYSAHQYMDIRKALREARRVLRPGGHLQIIGGTIDSYLYESFRSLMSKVCVRTAVDVARTVCNTLAYQIAGRRVFVPGGPAATTAPIYPDKRSMMRWLQQYGFELTAGNGYRCLGGDTCFLAKQPRRHTLKSRGTISSGVAASP